MDIVKLNKALWLDFRNYCEKYKFDHDESFLSDQDFESFEIGEQNPTYLLLENKLIKGVISLMLDDYFLRGERSRVRIFHCEEEIFDHYNTLAQAALPLDSRVKKIEMFIPDKKEQIKDFLKRMGFAYYRTSYVMVRKDKAPEQVLFPEGFALKPLQPGRDEEVYARIRNAAFKNLKGSETPLTVEDVKETLKDPDILNEGMQILYNDHEEPIGIVSMVLDDNEEGKFSFVAPIALIPEYQGKGLGSELLKAGIEIGVKNGLDDCMLCVNGENENAQKLYLKNGFELNMSVSCFVYPNN